jgi:hypothetical protein
MVTLEPIGVVSSPRREPVDDDWDTVVATITLDASRFSAERGPAGGSSLTSRSPTSSTASIPTVS